MPPRSTIAIAIADSHSQDVRYALRTLRRSPGFSAVVIVSLALGIGANTAIFSLINALMLRALPVRAPAELVELLSNIPSESRFGQTRLNSWPWKFYEHYRDHNHVFSDIIGVSPARWHVSGHGLNDETVDGEYVTGNFFPALGVQAAAGRLIGPADAHDDRPGTGDVAVAVISWSFWRSRFNLDPKIIGSRLTIEGVPVAIIGVAHQTFFGLQIGAGPDLWVPASLEPLLRRSNASSNPDAPASPSTRLDGSMNLKLLARLAPGVSVEQAGVEMRVLDQFRMGEVAARTKAPWARQLAMYVVPGRTGLSAIRQFYAPFLLGLMAVVGLLLLIACTNVASLLLARGAARQREMAVRVSLGAGRVRVIRQLVTESLVLSALGCIPGTALAYAGAHALVRIVASQRQFPGLPRMLDMQVQPDLRVLLFTAGLALLTALLFGLVSAWNAFVSAPVSSLREGGHATETPSRRLFGKSLIVAQVAVSIVLLSAAGLFIRHLSNLRGEGLGFERDDVLLVRLDTSRGASDPNQLGHRYRELLQRFSAIPGVRSATQSGITPIQGPGAASKVTVEGVEERAEQRTFIALNWVAPKYFDTFGTPIVAGRDFTFDEAETRPPVAIINQSMARHYFGRANPVGRRFTMEERNGRPGMPYEIVGVVVDAKYSDLHDIAPETIYLNAYQNGPGRFPQFALRTTGGASGTSNATAIGSAVQLAVRDVLKTVPIAKMTTLADQMDASIVPERLMATLVGLFGAVGALLAAIGLYGLLAYTVTRRVTEIAIRMALGATPRDVTRMVLTSAITLVAAGLAIGVPLAISGRRLAASVVRAATADAASALPIVIAAIAMLALALIAAYVPARRAARVQPIEALRQ
jgi:putative ABC transport system permease protein